MTFLDSDLIRPLYDTHQGGPPKAFRCYLTPWDEGNRDGNNKNLHTVCGHVTRTLRGMRTHQRIVHGIKPQQEIPYGNTNESGKESTPTTTEPTRQLRVAPKPATD